MATLLTGSLIAGCSPTAGSQEDRDASGVDFGATKAEYQAAFEPHETITLNLQTAGPKGSFSSKKEEDYAAAIEDWSGGKISFNLSYAQAIAPAGEEAEALAQGLVDVAMVTAQMDPATFPVNDLLLAGTMLISDGLPIVGPLQGMSYMQDLGFSTPEFLQEFDDAGLHVLLPFNIGSSMLFCNSDKSSLDALEGTVSGANSTSVADNLSALGVTPTALAYTEIFEALQRGVMDCNVSSVAQAAVSGLTDPAPYAMYSLEGSLGSGAQTFAMGKDAWDALPLVAQQLLFDRLDVLYQSFIVSFWETASGTVDELNNGAGGMVPFEPAVSDILHERGVQAVEAWRTSDLVANPDALADAALSKSEEWLDRLNTGLSIDGSVTFGDLATWWNSEGQELDLEGYTDMIYSEIMLEFRPS